MLRLRLPGGPFIFVVLLGLLLSVSHGAVAQQRIASLNLCTDLLLLELAERERIVSLTYWAADPDLSYLAGRAAGLHLNHSLAEEIVPRQPDLVLAGQYSDVQVVGLLRRLGYRVEVLDVPLTLEGMREHILAFGALIGEPERAGAMADRIGLALDKLVAVGRSPYGPGGNQKPGGTAVVGAQPEPAGPLAAVYGPQGVSPGTGTLMDDLLRLAGFRNLAAERGIHSYGTLSLEALVMARPDVLVIDDLSANADSVAHQALRHPVLRRQFDAAHTISLPPSLTACVGPTVVPALEILVSRRAALAGQS